MTSNHTACGPRPKAKGAGDKKRKGRRPGVRPFRSRMKSDVSGRRSLSREFSPKSLADEAQLAVGRAHGEDAALVDERLGFRSLELRYLRAGDARRAARGRGVAHQLVALGDSVD